MQTFDVIVVGGGPAGSSCARVLVESGMQVAVLDRATFPRVKLCAGWLSAPIWDVLGVDPTAYPHSLWTWDRCHVYYGETRHTLKAKGYFIRRYEFDDWLLGRSGAQVFTHSVKHVERQGDVWTIDNKYSARYIVGAGGTHCPVARTLFPPKERRPVGAQELEFEAPEDEIAATRVGEDGEPELLLHKDLRGYAWNIPKSGWLNVGCGTLDAKKVKPAWSEAQAFFDEQQHLPCLAKEKLEKAKGHSYYLYDPTNLRLSERNNAFLVGDALGLAHPLTAEGILPAVLSGQLCAQAIADPEECTYRALLEKNPIFADYAFVYDMREKLAALRSKGTKSKERRRATPAMLTKMTNAAVASGFAWMFSGQPLPARPLLRFIRKR